MENQIDEILEQMKTSDWYTAAVGADTLMRIRSGVPYKGETIDQWMRKTLKALLSETLHKIANAPRGEAHNIAVHMLSDLPK